MIYREARVVRREGRVVGDPDGVDYIQSMLRELRVQAAAGRHDMLAYLIEMAYVEASDLLRKRYSDNDR